MSKVCNKVSAKGVAQKLPAFKKKKLRYVQPVNIGFSIPLHKLSKWQLDYMLKILDVESKFFGKVNTHISWNGGWFFSHPIDQDNPLFNHSFNDVFFQ